MNDDWCGKNNLDNQCKRDFPGQGFLDKSRYQKIPGCKNPTITKIKLIYKIYENQENYTEFSFSCIKAFTRPSK